MQIIVFIILISIFAILYKYSKKTNNKYNFSGNANKQLLTNTELKFYKQLKSITDKYNLIIFSKVRLADIITTNDYTNFSKIKSKHIDFIITNENTEPILYIELDDPTHIYKNKQKINDNKKNIIFESIQKNLIRVKTNEITQKLSYIESILINKSQK